MSEIELDPEELRAHAKRASSLGSTKPMAKGEAPAGVHDALVVSLEHAAGELRQADELIGDRFTALGERVQGAAKSYEENEAAMIPSTGTTTTTTTTVPGGAG